MSNLRFMKVFVLDPSTKWSTAAAKPTDLAVNEAGAFVVDKFGVVGANIGATPTPATAPVIQIHQNIGDNQFGTVRSQPIDVREVKAFYGQTASAAQTEIWYLGYDGVDTAKTITVNKNEYITIHIHVWNNKLAKWFNNNPGYNKNVTVYTGAGEGAASAGAVADAIVAAINNSNVPANDFYNTTDLQEHVTATKVVDGVSGAVGVKIETKAINPQLLNAADPIKFFEVELTTLDVSVVNQPKSPSLVLPVTKTQAAASGSGFPAELAALEAESQGFDRVREVFENPRYMNLANYKILAADGKKYDYLYLEFDYTHNTNAKGATSGSVTEPYEVLLVGPTGTLTTLVGILNAWLGDYQKDVAL